MKLRRLTTIMIVLVFVLTSIVGCAPKKPTSSNTSDSSVRTGSNTIGESSSENSNPNNSDTSSSIITDSSGNVVSTSSITGNSTSKSSTVTSTSKSNTSSSAISSDSFSVNKKNVFKETITNMGGKTITIASPWNEWVLSSGCPPYQVKAANAMKAIENDYNCVVKVLTVNPSTMLSDIIIAYGAGKIYADIIESQGSVTPIMNYMEDVTKVGSLGLQTNTWDGFIGETTKFKGVQYGVGFMMTQNLAIAQSIMVYNKTLADQYNIGDLYDVVRKGNWNYTKFMDVCKNIVQATSGRTKGLLLQHDSAMNQLIYTNNFTPVGKDNAGYFFDYNNSNMLAALQFWSDYCKNGYVLASTANDYGATEAKLFMQRKSLFYLGEYIVTSTYFNASMEDKYGVLPLPKGPNATGYSSVNGTKYFSLTKSNPNILDAGKILVAMANRTAWDMNEWDTVQLETALRDNESLEMMKIITGSKQLSPVVLETGLSGAFTNAVYDVMRKQSQTPSQAMQGIKGSQQASINDIFK